MFELFADVGDARFHGLDAQFSLRFAPVMPSELQDEVRRRELGAYRADKCVIGRQMVRWIV
eukprot:1275618-Lingulodinium_polyedra.AAC.1